MAKKEEMQNGDVVAQDIRESRAVSEFLELKEEINGKSKEEVMEMYEVLEDSSEEEGANNNYLEIDAGDCEWVQMVYVDFDEDWQNAEIAYQDVTVLDADKKVGETENMRELIKAVTERAMENMCEWLVQNGAEYANVWREGEDNAIAGIEFSLHASDGQEHISYADFRDKDVEHIVKEHEFDEWLEEELDELYEAYDVNEEVLMNAEQCRKVGVRTVLESCEEIDAKLERLWRSA